MANDDNRNGSGPPTRFLSNDEWLPAAQALDLVTAAYAKRPAEHWGTTAEDKAKKAILRRLANGGLSAQAAPITSEPGSTFALWTQDGQETISSVLSDGDSQAVPAQFWSEFFEKDSETLADWLAGDFSFTCKREDIDRWTHGYVHGVTFNRMGLPVVGRAAATVQAVIVEENHSRTSATKRGRPAEWDWIGAIAHVAAFAHYSPHALHPAGSSDPNAAFIARLMEKWFTDTSRKSPADSQLRAHAKRVVEELNALKSSDAKNSKASA